MRCFSCKTTLLAFLSCITVHQFRWKRTSSTNPCWYQKTRVIILSYGSKISAVCYFFSSQSMCVTDRQTDVWTDRQNYDPQDRASIADSHGKNGYLVPVAVYVVVIFPNISNFSSVPQYISSDDDQRRFTVSQRHMNDTSTLNCTTVELECHTGQAYSRTCLLYTSPSPRD